MNKCNGYIGIDNFRLIAALLVIAIHTSPLEIFSVTADFILTRIAARTAVPFFFMVSGFFLINQYGGNVDKLKKFIKSTLVIYCTAIVLYIPINLYNGYFLMDNLVPNIIKDIVFDGTFYHLWYLPATIIGAVIAWLLVEKLGINKAFFIALFLYTIGLFGDSYFGISQQIPLLKAFYGNLFQAFDYTRNGIFFAPVFFIMGGAIAKGKLIASRSGNLIGFAISFIAMLEEGLFLHAMDLQRHDSMYIMLIPCMYFLFSYLTFFKGNRNKSIRNLVLALYIIHPMVIIIVRGAAKILGLTALLIDNSLIHYAAVAMLSFALSVVIVKVINCKAAMNLSAEKFKPPFKTDRSWLEINLHNLESNAITLQKLMPSGCEMMAVVKADGYGHSSQLIADKLNKLGIMAFAVATIDEGITLRKSGIVGEILILGYTSPLRAKELCRYNLTQTLIDYDYSVLLNNQHYNVKVHMKIDTGMHRLGFQPKDITEIESVFAFEHLDICGIFTHLCVAQSLAPKDVAFTRKQISDFYGVLNDIRALGIAVPKVHIQSSYGLLNYPELRCDYVRMGILLYGVKSTFEDEVNVSPPLQPVLSLKSNVVLIRTVPSGESVGYDRKFVAAGSCKIALLPIGYADGLPRNLSCENGGVLIRGKRAAIIGRICMDQTLVDVTDIEGVCVGDVATLIGRDGADEILATEVAAEAQTITNELLSRMGTRLKFVIK